MINIFYDQSTFRKCRRDFIEHEKKHAKNAHGVMKKKYRRDFIGRKTWNFIDYCWINGKGFQLLSPTKSRYFRTHGNKHFWRKRFSVNSKFDAWYIYINVFDNIEKSISNSCRIVSRLICVLKVILTLKYELIFWRKIYPYLGQSLTGLDTAIFSVVETRFNSNYINLVNIPLMPVGNYSYQFFICCPRDAVSRTANVERTVRH